MRTSLNSFIALVFCGALSGCELLCQAGTGTCGMSREEAHRLLNPKPYGTRWIKDGASDEQRLIDIKECGGNGIDVEFTFEQYQSFREPTDKSDIPAFFRLRTAWGRCMALKGYRWE